jgi:hypothetical protein
MQPVIRDGGQLQRDVMADTAGFAVDRVEWLDVSSARKRWMLWSWLRTGMGATRLFGGER